MRVKASKTSRRVAHKKCVTRGTLHRPEVKVVRFGGTTRILGSNAAAQFLGMRQQEFYRIVQNLLNPPPRVVSYQRKIDAVKAAYPELFEEAK